MDYSKYLAMLYTLAIVFAVTFGTQMLATGFDVFNIDIPTVQAAINAGISAVVVFLVNYANPLVTRYGIGSK